MRRMQIVRHGESEGQIKERRSSISANVPCLLTSLELDARLDGKGLRRMQIARVDEDANPWC